MMREVGLFCSATLLMALAAPQPPKAIAVVDLFKVLTTAKPFTTADDEIRRWIADQMKAFEQRHNEIDAKQNELELFSGDGTQKRRLAYVVDRMKADLDFDLAEADRARNERIVNNQRSAFDAATKAVAAYAKSKGIEIVLQLRQGDLTAKTQSELSSEIFLREVLYAGDALDVTSDVIAQLNAGK